VYSILVILMSRLFYFMLQAMGLICLPVCRVFTTCLRCTVLVMMIAIS